MAPAKFGPVNTYLERRFQEVRALPEERRGAAVESLRKELGVPDRYSDQFLKAASGAVKIRELTKKLVQEMPADNKLFKLAIAPEGQEKSTIQNAYKKMRERERERAEAPAASGGKIDKAPADLPIELKLAHGELRLVYDLPRTIIEEINRHPEFSSPIFGGRAADEYGATNAAEKLIGMVHMTIYDAKLGGVLPTGKAYDNGVVVQTILKLADPGNKGPGLDPVGPAVLTLLMSEAKIRRAVEEWRGTVSGDQARLAQGLLDFPRMQAAVRPIGERAKEATPAVVPVTSGNAEGANGPVLKGTQKQIVDNVAAAIRDGQNLDTKAFRDTLFETLGWDRTIKVMNALREHADPKVKALGDQLYDDARRSVDPHEWNNPYFNRTTFKLERPER
ncbi:MAG: hypothetical protein HY903_17785 [Deltaproteobacteria bacterium]|nr:hypothetical protein [Deltaproteobacteria bacterium]